MSTQVFSPDLNPERYTFPNLSSAISEKAQECIARVENRVLLRNTVKEVRRHTHGSVSELVDAVVEASEHGVQAGKVLVLQTPREGISRRDFPAFFHGIPESVYDNYGNIPKESCVFPLGMVAAKGYKLDEVVVGCPESGWFSAEAIYTGISRKFARIGFVPPYHDDPSEFLRNPQITMVDNRAKNLLNK